MDKRTTDIVCYCTWVGLLVAVLAGNREASRFHLNQSLVLGIFGLLGVIPCVGWVWAVFVAVWWCMGLTGAIVVGQQHHAGRAFQLIGVLGFPLRSLRGLRRALDVGGGDQSEGSQPIRILFTLHHKHRPTFGNCRIQLR